MFRSRFILSTVSLGLLAVAGPLAATSLLTSSNGNNVIASTSGTGLAVFQAWEGTLTAAPNGWSSISGVSSCSNQTSGCSATFQANGTFSVTGTNGAQSSSMIINTSSNYPLSISMPAISALTGLEIELQGNNMEVTLTLLDGSTVNTIPASYSSATLITFISPLQITSATVTGTSSGVVSDASWGTAIVADLPTQPVGTTGTTGTSDTPEAATFLLIGGGLLFMSRQMRRQQISL